MGYKIDNDKSWSETHRALADCFTRWGVTKWSAEPNCPANRTNSRGLDRAERAVTVTYELEGVPVTVSLDSQVSPAMNLRAIFLCLDAMRLIDYRGLGEIAKSAYLQLPPPVSEVDPWELFGLRPGADEDTVQAIYRMKARTAHPDHGGTAEAMTQLNTARDRLLEDARARVQA